MSGDIVKWLREAHQTVLFPCIESLYSVAADLLDAIDALHQPYCPDEGYPAYVACTCDPNARTEWPCQTARLLHPAGGPS